MKNILFSAFLAIAPAWAAAQEAAPQRIGAAAAVSGLVNATAPGATDARAIKSGSPLFLNDHVTTDGKGKMQILLLDETVFTIGPNSDMQLDEFVYDPSSDAGKVSVKITKGVFRFVTGKVARKEPANMKVKLSVGTIGIRGTIAAGRTDEQGSTVILLGPGAQNNSGEAAGAITIDNGSASVLIDQPGFGVALIPGQTSLQISDMSQQAAQLTSDLSADSSGDSGGTPPPAEGGGTEGSGSSASELGGQNTAAAGGTLADASGLGDMTQALGDTSNQAALDIISNPASQFSNWDDLRSIQTGSFLYSGTGSCTLSGEGGTSTTEFRLLVDFGARRYGDDGGASYIYLVEKDESTNILQRSFDSLTGPAVISLHTADMDTNHTNPYFDGSQITFNNLNGVPAANATVDVRYNDGTYSGSTTVIADKPKAPLPQ